MKGIVCIFYNQSLNGLLYIDSCQEHEENRKLEELNQNFFGTGEFYSVHSQIFENHERALEKLLSLDRIKDVQIPGKRFYKISIADVIDALKIVQIQIGLDETLAACDDLLETLGTIESSTEEDEVCVDIEEDIEETQEIDDEAEEYFRKGMEAYINYDDLDEIVRFTQAISYYQKAHDLGHPEAESQLADCYKFFASYFQYRHPKVEADQLRALELIRKAIELDAEEAEDYHINILNELGYLFEFGNERTGQDYSKAVKYFLQCHESGGDDENLLRAGGCYERGGYGIKKDLQKAIELYKRAGSIHGRYRSIADAYYDHEEEEMALTFYNLYFERPDEIEYDFLMVPFSFYAANNFKIPFAIRSSSELQMKVQEALYKEINEFLQRHFQGRINYQSSKATWAFGVLDYYKKWCLKRN